MHTLTRWLREGVTRLGLIALGTLLGLGLSEAFLRLLIPTSDVNAFIYTQETPRYRVMRPGVSGVANGVPFHTNRLGFRDDDDDFPPPEPGSPRIAVFGDSFTVSAGVPFESIFSSQLERSLRSQGRPVQVLNLAVGGYNIVQYELVLHEVALSLLPDLLIVAVYVPNDFENSYEDDRAIALGERSPPGASVGWRDLHSLRTLFDAGSRLRQTLQARADDRPDWRPGGWIENMHALLEIARTARQRKLPLLVVLLTGNFDYGLQEPQHRRVLSVCAIRKLHCVSTLSAFQQSGRSPRDYALNLMDNHPNEAYHAVVTGVILEALEEELD